MAVRPGQRFCCCCCCSTLDVGIFIMVIVVNILLVFHMIGALAMIIDATVGANEEMVRLTRI